VYLISGVLNLLITKPRNLVCLCKCELLKDYLFPMAVFQVIAQCLATSSEVLRSSHQMDIKIPVIHDIVLIHLAHLSYFIKTDKLMTSFPCVS